MPTSILNARKPRQPWWRVAIVLGGVGGIVLLMTISVGGSDEGEPPSQSHPDSLVASWVRAYPECGGCDTITLRHDGTATGPTTAVYGHPLERISEWMVGFPLGPTDLCFVDDGIPVCSGWVLRGDTLALANGQNTILIRATAFSRDAEDLDPLGRSDRGRFGAVPMAPKVGGNRP